METAIVNQDTRPLPEGWVQHYEPSKQLWYYVQMNIIPPNVTFTHPVDLAPPGKKTASSGSRPGSSGGPSPLSSPLPVNVSPQPSGRTFAQEFYASYINKTAPPMINSTGLSSLATASGTSQAQAQAQMNDRNLMGPSPPPVSSANWTGGQNSTPPPLRAPVAQWPEGSRQLPTPPQSSGESPVTSPAPYSPPHSNTSPNAQANFGNVAVSYGNSNGPNSTLPYLHDANHQPHRAHSLQTGPAVPDHLRHAPGRSQTFAPGQAQQVGYNPNSAVSGGIPVNGLRQTPVLVTQARAPNQSPNYTTFATNSIAPNAQFQPNQFSNYTTVATNHINQAAASRGPVSVGSTGAPSPPTSFSQTARAMAPLPSPPMSPPNNMSTTMTPPFNGSTFIPQQSPTFTPQMFNRPKNQLAGSMGKLATKAMVGVASGFISQATGLSSKAVKSVGNLVTDPKVVAMLKGAFSRQNGPIGDKDLQAVLQGHPNANYQGVIDALTMQQQQFNTIQMQASMAYKPIPQAPVDYPTLIAEVQRLQQQAQVQAQAVQTQAQLIAAQAAIQQNTLNNQYQTLANQLGQQMAQQGMQAASTDQQAQMQMLQTFLTAQGQQMQGTGLQHGQQQQQNVGLFQPQSAAQQQAQVPYGASQQQQQQAAQQQAQVPYGAPQQQQAGQQQSQTSNGAPQQQQQAAQQQYQSPNAFVAQVPQKPGQHSSVGGGSTSAPGKLTAVGGGQTVVSGGQASGGQGHPLGGQTHSSVTQASGGQPHISGGQNHPGGQVSGGQPQVSGGQNHSGGQPSQNTGQHPQNSGQQTQHPAGSGQPQPNANQQDNGGQEENPYMKLYDQMQDMYQQQQQQQQQPSYTDTLNSAYNNGGQQYPQQQQPSLTDMINSAFNGGQQPQQQQQPSLTDMINSTFNGGQQQPSLPDMINSAFNGGGQQQQPFLTDMINSAFNNGGQQQQQPSLTDYLNSAINGGSDSNPPQYDTSLLFNDPSSGGGGGGAMDNLVQSFANASLGGGDSSQADTSGLNGFVNGLTQAFSTPQTDPSAFNAGFDLGSLGDSMASSINNSWSDSS